MIRFVPFLIRSVLAVLLAALPSLAQDTAATVAPKFGWKYQSAGVLNLSQTYFENWAKGGTDAFNWDIDLSGAANLDQEGYLWENKARAVYGRSKLEDLASRKTSDEWRLETILTRKLGSWVNPFIAAAGWSQFTAGYIYHNDSTRELTSEFFDPAYFTQTLGAGFTPIPDFKERLGFGLKETWSPGFDYADDPGTDDKDEFRVEVGLSSITEYQKALMDNILGITKLDLFLNFKGVDEIDARWENKITAKVNKTISVDLELELLYDKDQSLDGQAREALSIGITFLSL